MVPRRPLTGCGRSGRGCNRSHSHRVGSASPCAGCCRPARSRRYCTGTAACPPPRHPCSVGRTTGGCHRYCSMSTTSSPLLCGENHGRMSQALQHVHHLVPLALWGEPREDVTGTAACPPPRHPCSVGRTTGGCHRHCSMSTTSSPLLCGENHGRMSQALQHVHHLVTLALWGEPREDVTGTAACPPPRHPCSVGRTTGG